MNVIVLTTGTDDSIPLTITNDDGTPVNITGYKIYFTAKLYLEDADDDAKIKVDVSSHSNPTAGVTSIPFGTDDTTTDPGIYYSDIKLKNAQGKLVSSRRDVCIVEQGVTRRSN